MKRITSTLLVAAIPALGLTRISSPGAEPVADPVSGSATAPLQRSPQQGQNAPPQNDDGTEVEDDGTAPPPEGFDPNGRAGFDVFGRRTKARGDTFKERLLGGWQLTRLDLAGLNNSGRLAQGFMHVGPSILSMEIHALYDTAVRGIPESDVHTTFTAEYRLGGIGELLCSTIIGSYVDETTGELVWERTGYQRRYTIREVRGTLELKFLDGSGGQSRLVFEPYVPHSAGELDIFGRQQGNTFEAKDIFGRSSTKDLQERDIYGKPISSEPDPLSGRPAEGREGTEEGTRPKESVLDLPPKGPGAGGAPLRGRGGR